MLLVPFYNTHVDGKYNTAVQVCVGNWLLDGIGELVWLCDWLQRWADENHRVPAACVAVGFHMSCQYINIANSSTQYSPQHTPISHLWIAWTYSESLCCCAFKVTPIAVSGTERGSGQNWAQTMGFRDFEVWKISAVLNKIQNQCRRNEGKAGKSYREPGT